MLLLSLILISLFPATPELAIHSTVLVSSSQSVCILTTSPLTYALYVTFKLSLRHILPAILILLCILGALALKILTGDDDVAPPSRAPHATERPQLRSPDRAPAARSNAGSEIW